MPTPPLLAIEPVSTKVTPVGLLVVATTPPPAPFSAPLLVTRTAPCCAVMLIASPGVLLTVPLMVTVTVVVPVAMARTPPLASNIRPLTAAGGGALARPTTNAPRPAPASQILLPRIAATLLVAGARKPTASRHRAVSGCDMTPLKFECKG